MSGTKDKRSPSDIASAKMGELLLQGYRMMDASCPHCGTVFMQSRNGENICVSCVGGGDDVEAMNQKNILNSTQSRALDADGDVCISSSSSTGGVDHVINDIIMEMQTTSGQLKLSTNMDGKQRILEHIKLCADIIKKLKQI